MPGVESENAFRVSPRVRGPCRISTPPLSEAPIGSSSVIIPDSCALMIATPSLQLSAATPPSWLDFLGRGSSLLPEPASAQGGCRGLAGSLL